MSLSYSSANVSGPQPQLIILADDLTGALDSGVEFANVGLRVIAATQPSGVDEALAMLPDVLVVNTASRECSGEVAKGIHERLRIRFQDYFPSRIFKKVDSRLKGNIAHEINGLIGADEQIDVLCASAIPDMGRVCRNGLLSGDGIEQPIDVARHLSDIHGHVSVPDCVGQDDFVSLASGASTRRLLVGARGLARGLALQMTGKAGVLYQEANLIAPKFQSLLVAIGSRDPITLAQIDSFLVRPPKGSSHFQAENGIFPNTPKAFPSKVLLQLTQGKLHEDRAVVGRRFVDLTSGFVKRKQYDSVMACGGETAQGLLQELDVEVLEIQGELFPGVPISTARFDSWSFSLITKSGGFGGVDLLEKLFQLVSLCKSET